VLDGGKIGRVFLEVSSCVAYIHRHTCHTALLRRGNSAQAMVIDTLPAAARPTSNVGDIMPPIEHFSGVGNTAHE